MTLKRWVLVPWVLALGCVAAPREVETTIDLGPQKVELDVRLKDIRTSGSRDLAQLRIFSEFATWKADWISDFPWAPTPSRFEYLSDGGQLDLAMHASMPRADFDRCARAAADAGVCEDFPLELGKAGYSIRPQVLKTKGLVVDPKAKTTWAADAGRIGYRVPLSDSEDKFIGDGPSLARGFELYRADPAAAAETIKKIDSAEELFDRGSVADWVKELAALGACNVQPWCGFRQEAARRDQLRLVYSYLKSRPEAGESMRLPPHRHLEVLPSGAGLLTPKDTLPLVDDLRLRVRYDVHLDAMDGAGSLWGDPTAWAKVCRPDTMKKPSLKDFCARLGVGSGAPVAGKK
jgi:hypothetical protein